MSWPEILSTVLDSRVSVHQTYMTRSIETPLLRKCSNKLSGNENAEAKEMSVEE